MSGSAPREWAVSNYRKGQAAETWIAGPQTIVSEEAEDTALRNAICGEAIEYDTERLCPKCGPVSHQAPRCPDCESRIDSRRVVVRRADPLDYGPEMRWEERSIDPDTKKLVKQVWRGSLATYRMACADEQRKADMERLRIAGQRSPDRVFLLPPV